MAKEQIKQSKPPEKKMVKGMMLSSLIGLISFLLGAYLLAVHFGIFRFNFEIPTLVTPIALVLCGLFLIKESSQRSILTTLKRRYERYI